MFKSIFQRMFFTYLTITVISVTTLATLLSHFISSYHLTQKQQDLLNQGNEINSLLSLQEYRNSPDNIQQIVDVVDKTTGTKIYILNIPSTALPDPLTLDSLKDNHLARDIPRILSGETITKKRQFSSQLNMDVVYVGMPLKVENQISGAVLLFSPLTEVDKIVRPIRNIVWLSAAAFMVLAAILISLVSRRISTPIIKMSQAAEDIAAGKFNTEITLAGTDEIAQLAKSFFYMRNRIQLTERMRQELMANISHELRTPLTSIRGFIQAILDGVVEPQEQRKYLKLSYREAGRLTKLTGDLLDLAKLQTGNLQLQRTEVDLKNFLEEVAAPFYLECLNKDIQLETKLVPNLMVHADPDRLTQVLINLLNNALKFTPSGGTITLRTQPQGDKVLIQLADTGIGMPEEELGEIFDHFYKIDKSRNAGQGGSGIGLYVAKQIVALHGGSITVSSQVGLGTTFTIQL